MIITKELEALLEPGVVSTGGSAAECIQLSTAITLRRIADKLDGKELSDNIYNAISTALFEDYQRRS